MADGGILAVYVLLAIGLTALEWIVRENPKIEESLDAHSTAPHTLTHFDQDAASFHSCLELIASAKQSIALEFFIYGVDEAARAAIVRRSALLGDSPLTQRLRFLLEMPIANLFDFLL
jgi:hypothetical protein